MRKREPSNPARTTNKWNKSSFTSAAKAFPAKDDGRLTSDLIGESVQRRK